MGDRQLPLLVDMLIECVIIHPPVRHSELDNRYADLDDGQKQGQHKRERNNPGNKYKRIPDGLVEHFILEHRSKFFQSDPARRIDEVPAISRGWSETRLRIRKEDKGELRCRAKSFYIQGKGVVPVVKALSNEMRLEILDFIGDDEVSVQTITERTGLSKTAILTHLKLLEEAGFIQTRYVPGTVGNQKVCRKMYDRLIFDFASVPSGEDRNYYETVVQPGNYFDFQLYPPCGLASPEHVINTGGMNA